MTTAITAPWKEYMPSNGSHQEALLQDWEKHLENLTTGSKKENLTIQQLNELSVEHIERHIKKQVETHGDFKSQMAWKTLIEQLCYLLKFEQRAVVATILDVIIRTFQLDMDTVDAIAIPVLFQKDFRANTEQAAYFRQQQDEMAKLTYLGVVINTNIVKGEKQVIDIANTLSSYFDIKFTKGHLTIFQTMALQLYADLITTVHSQFDSHFMIKKVLQPTLNQYLAGIHINDANYITCYLAVVIHPIYADYILTQVREFPAEAPLLHTRIFKMFMMKGFETYNIHPMLYTAMDQYKTQCEKLNNKKASYDHISKKETEKLVNQFADLFRAEFFSKHNTFDAERTQFIGKTLVEYLVKNMMNEKKPCFEGLTRIMNTIGMELMKKQESLWEALAKLHMRHPEAMMSLFKKLAISDKGMATFLEGYLKKFVGSLEGFQAILATKDREWLEQFLSMHVTDKPVFTLEYLKKMFDFAFVDQSENYPVFYENNDNMNDENNIQVDASTELISIAQTAFFNALSHLFQQHKIAKIEKLLTYSRDNKDKDFWVGFNDDATEIRRTLLELYDNSENKSPHLIGARRLILCILFYQLQLPTLLNVESLDDLVITVQGFNVAADGIDDITPEQVEYGTETMIDIALELCSIDASMKGGVAAALAPLFKNDSRKKSLELLFNVVIQSFVEEAHVTEVEGMHELVQDEMDNAEENDMEDDDDEEEEEEEDASSSEDDIDEEALELLANDKMQDEEEEEEVEDPLEWEGQDEFMFANDHLIASMFKHKKAQLDAERIVADEIATYRSNFSMSVLDILRHLVKESDNVELIITVFIFLTRRFVKNTNNFTLSPIQAKVHKSIHQFIEYMVNSIVLDFGAVSDEKSKSLRIVKGALSPKTVSSVAREVRQVIENMNDTKGMLPKCLQFLSVVFLEHPDEDGEIEKHTHSLFAKKIFHGSFTSSKAQRILHVLPWLLPKLSSSSLSQLEQLLEPITKEDKLSNTSFKRISQLLAFIGQLFNHPNMRANEPEKVARMVALLGILESSLLNILNSNYFVSQCLSDKHLHMNLVHALQQFVPLAKRHSLLTETFTKALDRYNKQLLESDSKLVAIRSRLNNIMRLANVENGVQEENKKPKKKKNKSKRKRAPEPEKSHLEPPSKLLRQSAKDDVGATKKSKKEKKMKKKMKHANKKKDAAKRKQLSF